MRRVFPLRRSRPLIWIALFAWLAQLCLPSAHAAVMGGHAAGLSGWCGGYSPAMAAKVAALPDEIRDIVAPHADAQAAMQAGCLLLCAGTAAVALPADGAAISPSFDLGAAPALARLDRFASSRPTRRPPPTGPPLAR